MLKNISQKLSERIEGVKENVLLKNFTTYKIGGPARYFFVVKNKEDLMIAVKTAKEFKLPIFILGGGSNLLVSDKGFDGLVIKNQISNIKIQNDPLRQSSSEASSAKYKIFNVGAGVVLDKLVNFCAKNSLTGLEWAAGIPGATIGGAIYGHAQAFGEKISDVMKSVEAIDSKTLKIKNFSKKQCRFSLKNSIFKKNKNLIIISAVLEFKEKTQAEIKKEIEKNISYRNGRHPINFSSAGSVFINPEIKIEDKKLLMEFPELSEYNNKKAVPAGYLISKCGLAGKKSGMAQISEQHSNFIINLGRAEASDVLSLIKLAKQKVKEKFGIDLELEVQLVGLEA